MSELKDKKIAIVCDWIKDMWGAERVLADMLEVFPHADIYTSVFFGKKNPLFTWKKVVTSFIQKIPFLNRSHKIALFLRPQAFESLDLSDYDVVISSSSAESKGVITKPNTLHICYCHTPTRYFWSHYHEYLAMMEFWLLNFFVKKIMPSVVHNLRQWDYVAAQRADFFVANSKNTQRRIEKYYKRKSEIIYPWVDSERFVFSERKKEYYFYAGRCIPYKKFDVVVEAFNKNKRPLIIATNTKNKLYKNLKKISNLNITWIESPSEKELSKLYSEAKAFVFPPEEDFGLAPIEAMISGTPVIAYKKGGALETVIEWKTGIFFENQTSNSLSKAIEVFETMQFDYHQIRERALWFEKKLFQQKLKEFILSKIQK